MTGVRSAISSNSSIVERDAELAGDREQMQDAVRRAAGRGDACDGVLERVARDDLGRAHVVAHEAHRDLAGLVGGVVLRGIGRGDVVQARGADAEELERHRHRVRGELAAARTRARARGALELVHVGVRHRSGGGRADRLEDVLDRDVACRGSGPARSSRCRARGPGRRDARAPSPRPGSSCRSRRCRRARRAGGRARRARSSRRSSRATRATRACPRCPSRRRRRRRSC